MNLLSNAPMHFPCVGTQGRRRENFVKVPVEYGVWLVRAKFQSHTFAQIVTAHLQTTNDFPTN